MQYSLHTDSSQYPVPAIFLDRDGTINVDKDYLYKISDWEWIPGAQQAIQKLQIAGFKIIIISNQSYNEWECDSKSRLISRWHWTCADVFV